MQTDGQAGIQQLRSLAIPDADILKMGCSYWQDKARSTEKLAAETGQTGNAVGSGFGYNQHAANVREAAKAYQRTYQRCLVISR